MSTVNAELIFLACSALANVYAQQPAVRARIDQALPANATQGISDDVQQLTTLFLRECAKDIATVETLSDTLRKHKTMILVVARRFGFNAEKIGQFIDLSDGATPEELMAIAAESLSAHRVHNEKDALHPGDYELVYDSKSGEWAYVHK